MSRLCVARMCERSAPGDTGRTGGPPEAGSPQRPRHRHTRTVRLHNVTDGCGVTTAVVATSAQSLSSHHSRCGDALPTRLRHDLAAPTSSHVNLALTTRHLGRTYPQSRNQQVVPAHNLCTFSSRHPWLNARLATIGECSQTARLPFPPVMYRQALAGVRGHRGRDSVGPQQRNLDEAASRNLLRVGVDVVLEQGRDAPTARDCLGGPVSAPGAQPRFGGRGSSIATVRRPTRHGSSDSTGCQRRTDSARPGRPRCGIEARRTPDAQRFSAHERCSNTARLCLHSIVRGRGGRRRPCVAPRIGHAGSAG